MSSRAEAYLCAELESGPITDPTDATVARVLCLVLGCTRAVAAAVVVKDVSGDYTKRTEAALGAVARLCAVRTGEALATTFRTHL